MARFATPPDPAGAVRRASRLRPGSPRAVAADAGPARPARFRVVLSPPARAPRRLPAVRARDARLPYRPLPGRAYAGLGGRVGRHHFLGRRLLEGTRPRARSRESDPGPRLRARWPDPRLRG